MVFTNMFIVRKFVHLAQPSIVVGLFELCSEIDVAAVTWDYLPHVAAL
jgi:hypothetical protein